MSALSLRGYYAILDWKTESLDPVALASRGRALLESRPCCLQLRAKRLGAAAMRAAAAELLGLCRRAGVPFCVNDRVDVALAVEADAVHVGQGDLPLRETRRLVGGRMAVGVSTHDEAQATAASADGADYIGFGPVFGTRTKDRPDRTVGLQALERVVRLVGVPVVAIGGIDLNRAPAVAATGTAAAAVIGAVEAATDAAEAGRRIGEAFRARDRGRVAT